LTTGAPLNERLDEGKIDQLRAWGSGLVANGSDDLRATGKAILLLIEEIERLHIDLWNAKAAQGQGESDPTGDEEPVQTSLDQTLRGRLNRVLKR
jgi:hypothetical protein